MALEKLRVLLSLSDRPFVRGLKGAARSIRSFSGRVARLGRVLRGTGALITGLATGALAVFVKRQAAAIDVEQKLARTIGTTSKEVNILGIAAARTAGITDKELSAALGRFTKRLGLAVSGSGAAARAIKQMGLNAADLVKLPLSRQIEVVASKINALDTAAERAGRTTEFFGDRAVNMANFLRDAVPNMEQFRRLAEVTGQSISEAMGRRVEAANDAMANLMDLVRGVGRQIAVGLAPIVTDVSNRLLNFAASGPPIAERVGKAVSTLINLFNQLKTLLEPFLPVIKAMFVGIGIELRLAGELVALLSSGFKGLAAAASQGLSLILRLLAKVTEALAKLPDFLGGSKFENMSKGLTNLAKGTDKLAVDFARSAKQDQIDMIKRLRSNPEQSRAHDLAAGRVRPTPLNLAPSSANGRTQVRGPSENETNDLLRDIRDRLGRE